MRTPTRIGKKGLHWAKTISEANEVHVSSIVLGELRYGFALSNKMKENEADLEAFLRCGNVNVNNVNSLTTHCYAELKKHLRSIGKPLPENDIWIALTCMEMD